MASLEWALGLLAEHSFLPPSVPFGKPEPSCVFFETWQAQRSRKFVFPKPADVSGQQSKASTPLHCLCGRWVEEPFSMRYAADCTTHLLLGDAAKTTLLMVSPPYRVDVELGDEHFEWVVGGAGEGSVFVRPNVRVKPAPAV